MLKIIESRPAIMAALLLQSLLNGCSTSNEGSDPLSTSEKPTSKSSTQELSNEGDVSVDPQSESNYVSLEFEFDTSYKDAHLARLSNAAQSIDREHLTKIDQTPLHKQNGLNDSQLEIFEIDSENHNQTDISKDLGFERIRVTPFKAYQSADKTKESEQSTGSNKVSLNALHNSDKQTTIVLFIYSRLNDNVQLIDATNSLTLLNAACSNCPDLASNSGGAFLLLSNIDYQLQIISSDGRLLAMPVQPMSLTPGADRYFILASIGGEIKLTETIAETYPIYDKEILTFNSRCTGDGWGGVECQFKYLGSHYSVSNITYDIIDLDNNRLSYPYSSQNKTIYMFTNQPQGEIQVRLKIEDKFGRFFKSAWKKIDIPDSKLTI